MATKTGVSLEGIMAKKQKKKKRFNFKFKDQPDGKCAECQHNTGEVGQEGDLSCDCPVKHITNIICILKRQDLMIYNIYTRVRRLDDAQDSEA